MAEVKDKEEVPATPAEDSYDDAWNEESGEIEGDKEEPIEEPEEPEGEAKEPTPDEPVEAEEPEAKEELAKDDPPAKEEVEDGKPSYDELEDQFTKLQHKNSTLEGMYNSEVRKRSEAPKEEPEPEEEEPEETFTLDTESITKEIEELPSFKAASDEHGEEVGAVLKDATGLMMEKVNGALKTMSERVKERFGEVSDVVKPMQADHVRSKDEARESTIKEAHPEYRTYVDSGELREWVDTHDGIELDVLNGVMKKGTTPEAIKLITKFREAKGYVEKPEEAPEADDSKKEKLENMEAVETKKRPVSPGKGKASKENFDDSWDEA